MLVKESETNKEELVEAIRNKNRMRIKEIIHRMFPMWEMLGIAEELQEYRNLVHDDSSGDQVMKELTLKITASLDRLVSAAENEINSLIRQENEKENTEPCPNCKGTGLNVAAMLSQPPWMNLRQKEY